MTDTNKRSASILGGGTSLKDKLSKAKRELDALQDDEEVIASESSSIPTLSQVKEPVFHLTGRCNRKETVYKNKAFYILDGLEREIKSYCSGGDVALYNYLMHLGLMEIKKRQGHSFDEVSKMEAQYLK